MGLISNLIQLRDEVPLTPILFFITYNFQKMNVCKKIFSIPPIFTNPWDPIFLSALTEGRSPLMPYRIKFPFTPGTEVYFFTE